MSVDLQKMDQQMEKIKQREERIRKEKAAILKKKKEARELALMKMGEFYFEQYRVDHGIDPTPSLAALLTSIEDSKLNDKEKRKLSDLIEGGILNFERSKPKEEIADAVKDYARANSNFHA